MAGRKFDPEFWRAAGPVLAIRPPTFSRTPMQLRASVNAGLKSLNKGAIPDAILETKHHVTSFDGEQIPVYQYSPKVPAAAAAAPPTSGGAKQPAFVYVHGGGLVAGQIEPFSRLFAATCALHTGVQMFAVEYRLPPDVAYPTPVEDCYAALRWLSESGGQLGVDPARLGFYAVSAGGGLGVGAALMARDRGLSPPLAKQILVYPMLDDRTCVAPDDPLCGFLTWTNRSNLIGWNAYLAGKAGGEDVPEYAAPARAVDLGGLPSTYIDVGSLDLFCREAVTFAGRLAAADVQLELHVYPGLPHIFDLYAPDIELARRAAENRRKAAMGL
ncbi:Carboxylesterase NlhH [Colletotrichum orbiculare MAFF 240422]|uniref:Carboxylesterase NlhH n=1 Tax=Colletotrichum orbiculare (strain 104-T / ATCC 96160 / CBS 514.97 / LARS 414 / MAFF 240422) TaxID=1213857 RepID=A0A484G482_COLOR|nr:Carboxylesterase NlhH [Colletotrichum orbiculare MAFF 240422]